MFKEYTPRCQEESGGGCTLGCCGLGYLLYTGDRPIQTENQYQGQSQVAEGQAMWKQLCRGTNEKSQEPE